MDDKPIIRLLFDRSEQALAHLARKFGPRLFLTARNILGDDQDAEECVNDTYIRAWNSMPSNRPNLLAPYLGKMTRWLALDQLDKRSSQKRGGTVQTTALEDTAEQLTNDCDNVHSQLVYRELCEAIERFLRTTKPEERQIFLARYWYMASIQEISLRFGYHESKVKSMLMRTRNRLMNHLKEEELW